MKQNIKGNILQLFLLVFKYEHFSCRDKYFQQKEILYLTNFPNGRCDMVRQLACDLPRRWFVQWQDRSGFTKQIFFMKLKETE